MKSVVNNKQYIIVKCLNKKKQVKGGKTLKDRKNKSLNKKSSF